MGSNPLHSASLESFQLCTMVELQTQLMSHVRINKTLDILVSNHDWGQSHLSTKGLRVLSNYVYHFLVIVDETLRSLTETDEGIMGVSLTVSCEERI